MALEALAIAAAVVVSGRGWLGSELHGLSDALLYAGYAHAMALGRWPYLDFPVEYPPLALLLFAAAPAGGSLARYQFWFSLEMAVCLVAAAGLTAAAAWRWWADAGRVLLTGVAVALASAAAGTVVLDRFDAAVALTLAFAIAMTAARRWGSGGAALGLGAALKLVPMAFLPVLLWSAGGRWRRAAVAAAVATAIPFAPFLALAPDGVLEMFRFQGERPLQVESVPATPLMVIAASGAADLPVLSSHGSQNIGGVWAGRLAATSGVVLVLGLIVLCLWLWRRRCAGPPGREAVPGLWLAVGLALVCVSKVLSPQYMVWLLPAVGVVVASRRRTALVAGGLVIFATVLTGVEFPARYWQVVALDPSAVALVAVRNAALVGALGASVLHLAQVWRACSAPGGEQHQAVVVGVRHRQAEDERQPREGDA